MAAQSFPAAPADPEPLGYRGPRPNFLVPRIGDVIDVLPEAAADKLRALRQLAEDARVLAREAAAKQEELNIARMGHQARLKQLMLPRAAGGYHLTEDAPQVVEVRTLLDKANAEYKRRGELSDVRYAQCTNLQRLDENISQYLRSGIPGGCSRAVYEGTAPVLKKGDDVSDAIESRRRRVRELRADLHRTRSAPYPSSEARMLMLKQIEKLADRGAPSVLNLIENKGPIEFVTTLVRSKIYNSEPAAVGFTEGLPDVLALVAWLFRGQLITALDAEITNCADDAAALTDEERQKQEVTILADILAVEREEVGLVDLATSQGISIPLREDTSPLAVLGLMLVTAAAPAPSDTGAAWVNELIVGDK